MIDRSRFSKSSYLRANDLTHQRTSATIADVREEEIGPDKDRKLVIKFSQDSGLAPSPCNMDRLDTLLAALGPDESTWIGKTVVLVKCKTRYAGQLVDSYRFEIPEAA